MATIRELFHEIGNWHNKISMGAGVTKEILKRKSFDTFTHKELKEVNNMLIRRLSELEKHTLGADKVLIQLKNLIYNLINPDTGKRKKQKEGK